MPAKSISQIQGKYSLKHFFLSYVQVHCCIYFCGFFYSLFFLPVTEYIFFSRNSVIWINDFPPVVFIYLRHFQRCAADFECVFTLLNFRLLLQLHRLHPQDCPPSCLHVLGLEHHIKCCEFLHLKKSEGKARKQQLCRPVCRKTRSVATCE